MREFYAAALPANVWNWVAVWRHNYLAWKKVAFASILGNLADPMIYLFGLGFGFGIMAGRVDGASYTEFLAAGMVATSAMTAATFETIYAAFSRMHVQRMWDAILCTRLTLGDIVLGELAWAATKAFFAGIAVMVVATVLGYAAWSSILYASPAIALTGLAFASLAMILAALAPSHDYFVFYQTLVLTPMVLLSGVIFPISKLPAVFCDVARFLPLAHSVDLIRPPMLGHPVVSVALHIGALCICTVLPFFLSVALLRRRLMS